MNRLNPSFEMATQAAHLMDSKKADDVTILQTEQVSSLADYFIIATVQSRAQMQALHGTLLKLFREQGINLLGQEMDQTGRWSLLDYGDIVVHLFQTEDRAYYNLERFWNHATEIPKDRWMSSFRQAS